MARRGPVQAAAGLDVAGARRDRPCCQWEERDWARPGAAAAACKRLWRGDVWREAPALQPAATHRHSRYVQARKTVAVE